MLPYVWRHGGLKGPVDKDEVVEGRGGSGGTRAREMSLPDHDKVILLCSSTSLEADVKGQLQSILIQVEWARLITRAGQLEMTPLLYHHLKKMDASLVPADVRGQLTDRYTQNLSRNLLLSRELLGLTEIFQDQAIPFVPVKGIILAETVYRDLGLRQMCDLDVLVRREDVQRAVRVLTEHGFHLQGRVPSTDAELERQRDVTLRGSVGRWSFPLELHWKFKDSFFRLPEDALWDHLADYRWNGKTIKIFSPELTLIHLIHHLNYHAFPLKILVDVAETLRAFRDRIDWELFWRLVREWRLVRNVVVALTCVSSVLRVPLPEPAGQGSRYLESQRRWLPSIVSREGWYFSQRALTVQSHGHLRALFSALFLDGGSADVLSALLGRLRGAPLAEPGAAGTGAPRTICQVTIRNPQSAIRNPKGSLASLISGLLKLVAPHRK